MPLSSGQKLGAYEILGPLGAGGMGEVYLGRDPKLDRRVAIKVLPEALTCEPEQVARFEREARLLATLNHPNIAAVHGFDDVGDMRYLVMEYVEGRTLAEHLKGGVPALDAALDVARQIAEALDAAHDKGVIHRDLKPGNVMVDAEGNVKVLDFGLAKAVNEDTSSSILVDSPTITAQYTKPGIVLGTAAYMSPEQARGRPVDKRTDIWSFGVVLYECLTGISPFKTETVSDSIGAILHKDVDLTQLPAATPPGARRVLERCLERDRKSRLRDIGDARIELERSESADDMARPVASLNLVRLIALLAVALGLGVFAGTRLLAPPLPPLTHVSIEPPANKRIRFSGDLAGPPVVSPDGSRVVFVASAAGEPRMLMVRRLDEPHAVVLPGTDGALFPFWSPDSKSLGFFTLDKLKRVEVNSRTVLSLAPVGEARGGCWTADDRILYAPNFRSGLFVIDARGGEPAPLTELASPTHTTHRWPHMLPGGREFLFMAAHRDALMRESNGVYIGSLDGQTPRRLMRSDYGAQFVDGWLLFVRDGVLLASKLDVDAARLHGDTHVVARNVAADLSTWHPQFSASPAGVLAFNSLDEPDLSDDAPGRPVAGFEGDRVTSIDRNGRPTTHYADGWPLMELRLSPDGTNLALSVQSQDGSCDLWIHPTAWIYEADGVISSGAIMDPNAKRVTFDAGSEMTPVWSPDGAELAFQRLDGPPGTDGIYRKRIGGGSAELLLALEAGQGVVTPAWWSPDGKTLVFIKSPTNQTIGNIDIWALPLEGGERYPLVNTPELEWLPSVSPDGRWLSYSKRQGGQDEVFVIPFAPSWPEDARPREWQVSVNGGQNGQWREDGTELYYISTTGLLMAVPLAPDEDTFRFNSPKPMFQTPYEAHSSYDVSPDNDKGLNVFYFTDSRQAPDAPISVILNWQQAVTQP